MGDSEELTRQICKVGGPLVLFGCTPLMAWIFWKVAQKDILAGIPLKPVDVFQVSAIVLVSLVFGIWMCRKGYGWFGGEKPPRPQL